MNPRKKILLLVPRFPFPPLSGGEKWLANLIEFLSSDFDLYLFSFLTDNMEKQQTAIAMDIERKYVKKIFLIKKPDMSKSASGLPYLPKIYACQEASKLLKKIVKEVKPDMAHIIFFEMAQYSIDLPKDLPKLYTEIDASYFYPWKGFLREMAGLKGFFKISEIFKTLKYTKKYFPLFDAATAIAFKDGKNIRKYFNTHIYYTPNAIKVKDFVNNDGKTKRKNQILFLGHYPHFPNEDAALRLVKKIFPKIKKIIPSAKLCLAGSFPTEKIKNLSKDDISVPGTVADVREFFWQSEVFAAPTKYGLGTKGKILEAFAAGIPVVASKNAVEGIRGARHKENVLIAKTNIEFAKYVGLLLLDKSLAKKISLNAYKLVSKDYDFSSVAKTFKKLYNL
jgi:glycosyltransferase involved in cell wall biosynthesis